MFKNIFSSPVFFCVHTLNNPSAHPSHSYSYSYYYLLSPSTQFFAHLIVLHILLFCTFYSIAHFTLISVFYHIYALVLCYFYIILNFYYFALSTERTWFDYISLLIIPCIIYYVTNKETLKPWPWTNPQRWGASLLLCKMGGASGYVTRYNHRISDFFSSATKTLLRWLFADAEICCWSASAAGLGPVFRLGYPLRLSDKI